MKASFTEANYSLVELGEGGKSLLCQRKRYYAELSLVCSQWRAEGGADGATAPGIHPGGIQGASFCFKKM